MQELKETLSVDSLMLENDDIERIISEVDGNEDGVIDYNEFIKMMKKDTVSRSMSKLVEN
jgi:Ca2+-binding EF-hand superfamily protein